MLKVASQRLIAKNPNHFPGPHGKVTGLLARFLRYAHLDRGFWSDYKQGSEAHLVSNVSPSALFRKRKLALPRAYPGKTSSTAAQHADRSGSIATRVCRTKVGIRGGKLNRRSENQDSRHQAPMFGGPRVACIFFCSCTAENNWPAG